MFQLAESLEVSRAHLALQLELLPLDDVGVVGQARHGPAAHLPGADLAPEGAGVVAVVLLVGAPLDREHRVVLLQLEALLQLGHLVDRLVILLPATRSTLTSHLMRREDKAAVSVNAESYHHESHVVAFS